MEVSVWNIVYSGADDKDVTVSVIAEDFEKVAAYIHTKVWATTVKDVYYNGRMDCLIKDFRG